MKRILLSILMLLTLPVWSAESCEQDAVGKSVCLDKPARRIISLAPNITELLFAAGAGNAIVGVDGHSDYPPAVSKIATIGGFPSISIEALLALRPDLVVAWNGMNSPQLSEKIASLGIPIFHLNPATIPGVAASLRTLGRLAGTNTVANQAADAFTSRYQKLRGTYADRKKVTVFYEMWASPLLTVGEPHLTSQLMAMCGGINIFSDLKKSVPAVDIESVLVRNPDVIITRDNFGKKTEQAKHWQSLNKLDVVGRQHIFSLPDQLISLPTPRILDGAELLCKAVDAVRKELSTESTAKPST